MMFNQPGNAIRLVAAPCNRHIAWALGAPVRCRQVRLGKYQPRCWIILAAIQFFLRQLAILHRVISLDANAGLAIGN